MAYTKTVWKDYPDTTTKMTAQKLNNIEDGIEDLDLNKANKLNIITGTEVLTGESIDGKNVYVKRYAQPFDNTTASFSHGLTEIIFVDIRGYYANGVNYFPLASIRNGYVEYTTDFYIVGDTVIITTNSANRTGYTAYVDLYYTKN